MAVDEHRLVLHLFVSSPFKTTQAIGGLMAHEVYQSIICGVKFFCLF